VNRYALYWPALIVATVGAGLVAIGAVSEPVRETLARPVTYVAAGVTVILFLRMLFDPACRRGIDAANKEIQGERPFAPRWSGFSDNEWGLFGSRTGDRPLQLIRAILFIEFVVALLLASEGATDLLLLATASFAVAMILSIIHVGLNTAAEATER
jgi:hypothetical protein